MRTRLEQDELHLRSSLHVSNVGAHDLQRCLLHLCRQARLRDVVLGHLRTRVAHAKAENARRPDRKRLAVEIELDIATAQSPVIHDEESASRKALEDQANTMGSIYKNALKNNAPLSKAFEDKFTKVLDDLAKVEPPIDPNGPPTRGAVPYGIQRKSSLTIPQPLINQPIP
jgi:hypothetical protein